MRNLGALKDAALVDTVSRKDFSKIITTKSELRALRISLPYADGVLFINQNRLVCMFRHTLSDMVDIKEFGNGLGHFSSVVLRDAVRQKSSRFLHTTWLSIRERRRCATK